MTEEYLGYKIVAGEGNQSRYKRIRPLAKGSVPTVLTGLYTNAAQAKQAIDLQKSRSKVRANATKQSNG